MNLKGLTLYAVHGWKIEEPAVGNCLVNLAPDVIEIGLRLVFPKDQKYAFFGEILAKIPVEESPTVYSFPVPEAGAGKRLAYGLKLMGLESLSMTAPVVWLVAG